MPLSLSKQRLALIRFDLWNVDLQTLLQYVISSQRIVTRGRITDADFSREKLMWYRPVGSNAVGCSSRSDIVVDFFGCVPQQWFAVLFNGRHNPPNFPFPFLDGLDPYQPQNGISFGSVVYAGLTNMTDRRTHRPRYSLCSNEPHLAIVAMKPK